MKNKKLLFAILIVIVSLLNACSASDSPSAAVKKAFAAAEKGDWYKFDEYSISSMGNKIESNNFIARDRIRGFIPNYGSLKNIISETINGDEATVKASFKNGKDYDLKLIKHNGKWKIHFR
jgi:outer membrane lipoprotein-sorting protein